MALQELARLRQEEEAHPPLREVREINPSDSRWVVASAVIHSRRPTNAAQRKGKVWLAGADGCCPSPWQFRTILPPAPPTLQA